MAPTFDTMVIFDASLTEKPFVFSMYVGNRSWLPCDKKLNPAV